MREGSALGSSARPSVVVTSQLLLHAVLYHLDLNLDLLLDSDSERHISTHGTADRHVLLSIQPSGIRSFAGAALQQPSWTVFGMLSVVSSTLGLGVKGGGPYESILPDSAACHWCMESSLDSYSHREDTQSTENPLILNGRASDMNEYFVVTRRRGLTLHSCQRTTCHPPHLVTQQANQSAPPKDQRL
jgi:hypothetical protein